MTEIETSAAAWGVGGAVGVILLAALGLGLLAAAADVAVTRGGGLRPVVDVPRAVVRELLRQRRSTLAPDLLLWRLGGASVLVLAVLTLAVVPVGGRTLVSTSADLVWFNAMEAMLWAAVWLIGWGPNAVHALVGGYRFLAQGLAYELPLMFALITAGLAAGSLRTTDVVAAQANLWFVVSMPLSFLVFVASAAAFAFWGPFAAPAAPDVAGGVVSELSGVDRLVVQGGRSVFLGSAAAMASALFLGGGSGPLLPGWAWHLVKTVCVLVLLVVAGRRLPVLRPDRVMDVAWVVVLPASVLQALVVALLLLGGFYR